MVLEQNVIIGTFTHRKEFLSELIDSVAQNFPNIPFIIQYADQPINKNMEALRQKFLATNRRYWVFIDHDIKFLYPDTIKIALETMLKGRFALVGVYSTFDPEYKSLDGLEMKEVGWVPGYFQMVDSKIVGHMLPDLNLPDSNTAIDTSYCVAIKALGYKIGLTPTLVYHTYKKVWMDQEAADKTNIYVMEKWGQFYFDCCGVFSGIVGKIPEQGESVMERNKIKLMAWQKEHYHSVNGETRINMGCGEVKLAGYINCDIQGCSDIRCNMQNLPFKDNFADEISCHHSLEHIPQNEIVPTLKDWFRVLKPGGILDLGIPDIELCTKEFLNANEKQRWNWNIYTIYGIQTDKGQFHMNGLSLNRAKELLNSVGFNILDSYNYDGWETPSSWLLCQKV